MNILTIIIFLVVAIILFEVIKHLFFKKTTKLFFMIFILFIVFLFFCYAFKDFDFLKGNSFVQTGAVIADKTIGLLKEKVDSEVIINSTLKSNKLFKS